MVVGSFSTIVSFSYRYASLYFLAAVEKDDNELITLELVHRYVELLDKYFGSVSLPEMTLCCFCICSVSV